MILGLILARGGSKRLPRKNLQPLGGKPLIAWTIEAARQSKLINATVLSSDDDEILVTAMSYSCDIHQRSMAAASDCASSEDAAREVLRGYPDCSTVVLLQPTSPFRTTADIDDGIAFFRRYWMTSAVSAYRPKEANGAVYVADARYIRAGGTFVSAGSMYYPMPRERSVDIDTWEDLREAERLISA